MELDSNAILRSGSTVAIYGAAALLTAIVALGLYTCRSVGLIEADSFIYHFFFRCWYIQFLNTWLLIGGVLYWLARYYYFRNEDKVFRTVLLPDGTISRERAERLIGNIPQEYKTTLTFKRLREILRAFLYGEDIIRMNEELSRSDIETIRRGHLVLDSLRNLIPVVGFLGTVLGLSLGMTKFPQIANLLKLREALRGFAVSLSVAFDTTLLALVYAIVIILLSTFLRQKEELLVEELNERARAFIDQLKIETMGQGSGLEGELAHSLERVGDALVRKLEEIGGAVRQPPQYQIIVKPLGEEDEHQ